MASTSTSSSSSTATAPPPPAAAWNFSAGPGALPRPVLLRAQAELLDFAGTGHSLMELSHRSPPFEDVLARAERDLRALLRVPDTGYQVLFMQGGATAQFSAVAYNLLGGGDAGEPPIVDYVVTGAWSQKAAEEARRLGARVHRVVDTKASGHTGAVPPTAEWAFSGPSARYVFYCENETIHGVEFGGDATATAFPFESVPPGVPVVCDMSSSILSRPVDVSRFGVIFAGAQKNMGPAGVTVVIVRDDLVRDATRRWAALPCPLVLDYKVFADAHSMYNTPPTWSIYLCGLVFDWLRNDVGGLEAMAELNLRKSGAVYNAIDSSNGFYRCPVLPAMRSRMNVPFRIYRGDAPSKELEVEFVKAAEARGMSQLAGHRSVGGMRASLYNAVPLEAAQALVAFMKEFAASHQS